MQKVLSVRLYDEDMMFVQQTAREQRTKKATVLRELLEKGRLYVSIEEYRKGKVSIGKAAQKAGRNISEMMDVLAELGVKSPVTKAQYLESLQNLEKEWK